MWEIDYRHVIWWLDRQDDQTVAHVFAALELLRDKGPGLDRPLVDSVKGSTVANMKELRPASSGTSEVRLLFAFDPRRQAILLFAGDKSTGKKGRQRWSGWYKEAIPKAERIWRKHLRELGEEDG